MTAPLSFRLLRAAAFAAICTGLGIGAHLLASGTPPTRSILLGLLLSFAAAVPVLGRERSLGVLLPLLAGLQVVLHLLFALTHTAAVAAPAVHPHGHAHQGSPPGGLSMVVLHGCAVALTALWLSWGEALLWDVLRHLAMRFVRVVLAWIVPEPVRCAAVPFTEPRPPLSAPLRHTVHRRGPPGPL
ncbi:MFS transporter [Thermomonospora amylolytica]|uniref:MFS transporter n=1 Tax=Thermomonospora amylolytica TaxID=1411117 RepID=UPI000E6BB9A8|nr:MFS transporter [Thermomonospora amylolytica]